MKRKYIYKRFDQLTTRELYEIVRSRTEIFLLEQRIICQDFDGIDYDALHCFITEGDRVVAYLRAYSSADGIHIGRVLSLRHGEGLGRELMERSLPIIKEYYGDLPILLHAQTHAEGFYKKLGFTTVSERFMEEGIPHVEMRL